MQMNYVSNVSASLLPRNTCLRVKGKPMERLLLLQCLGCPQARIHGAVKVDASS